MSLARCRPRTSAPPALNLDLGLFLRFFILGIIFQLKKKKDCCIYDSHISRKYMNYNVTHPCLRSTFDGIYMTTKFFEGHLVYTPAPPGCLAMHNILIYTLPSTKIGETLWPSRGYLWKMITSWNTNIAHLTRNKRDISSICPAHQC